MVTLVILYKLLSLELDTHVAGGILLSLYLSVTCELINQTVPGIARDSLIEAAAQMKEINDLNSQLLAQAIELTEFDITLFKSMKQAPETANYDRNAYNTGDILGSSGFDAKQ